MAWGTIYSDGRDELIKFGLNADVVDTELALYERWKDQPQTLIDPELYQADVEEKCYSVFCYLCEHVGYKEDPDGVQWIKSPARLLRDRIGDCKSLTMFVVCCLHCLGVRHVIRFVNFDGGDQYTHVYPVAIDEQGREIVLDACELNEDRQPIFDYARPYKKKIDFVLD